MSLVERAYEIRERLRNPPNAVPDHGIDLKRREEPPAPIPPRITPVPDGDGITKRKPSESEIEFAERQILYYQGRLNSAKARHRELAGNQPTRRVPIKAIQRAVCLFYRTDREEMLGPCRAASLVRIRHIAMYLAKDITKRSLPEIGREFADRDHTSVIHAVRKIEAAIVTDPELKAEIHEIKEMFVASTTNPEDAPCNSPPTTAQ
jgi:hypothetical protein